MQETKLLLPVNIEFFSLIARVSQKTIFIQSTIRVMYKVENAEFESMGCSLYSNFNCNKASWSPLNYSVGMSLKVLEPTNIDRSSLV